MSEFIEKVNIENRKVDQWWINKFDEINKCINKQNEDWNKMVGWMTVVSWTIKWNIMKRIEMRMERSVNDTDIMKERPDGMMNELKS